MNKEKDEDLDKVFRKGLEDPVNEAAYREADWDAMEQMLDQRKKRSAIIRLLPVLGSVAALLLIFLGYLFLKPNITKPTKNEQMSAAHHKDTASSAIAKTEGHLKNNTGTSGEPARKVAADSSKQQGDAAQYAVSPPVRKARGENGKSFFSLSQGKARRHATGTDSGFTHNNTAQQQQLIANQPTVNQSKQGNATDQTGNANAGDRSVLNTPDSGKQPRLVDANTLTADIKPKEEAPANDNTKVEKTDENQKGVIAANTGNKPDTGAKLKVKGLSRRSINRPVFALGILASSDLNGVNSAFQQSKIGGNFGAVLSVTFAKKWTISTGATYDVKPYLTNFANYHTAFKFPENPQSVNADCRMLDIPVNINYQVYSQRGNKITLGTGLSSYFMLREDYNFNYNDPYETGPTHYAVINKNRNILSVLNIDATYTHQINSKMGVTVQPYTKVPLSNVGASQVRLQSTGVALGVNWYLNASSKPK